MVTHYNVPASDLVAETWGIEHVDRPLIKIISLGMRNDNPDSGTVIVYQDELESLISLLIRLSE